MKKIKIRLVKPTSEKLRFVKLIKECSGMGLMESKNLCDNLHAKPLTAFEMPIRDYKYYDFSTGITTPADIDYKAKFVSDIKEIDGEFIINGGTQWERNVKMLSLGIGDESDYSEFIEAHIISSNLEESKNVLNFVLSKLSKEELIEVFSKINLEI